MTRIIALSKKGRCKGRSRPSPPHEADGRTVHADFEFKVRVTQRSRHYSAIAAEFLARDRLLIWKKGQTHQAPRAFAGRPNCVKGSDHNSNKFQESEHPFLLPLRDRHAPYA